MTNSDVAQLGLLPEDKRERQEPQPDAVHIPDWLTLDEQVELLEWLRVWCKGGFVTPKLPYGDLEMSVRVCCLGYHWEPYQYSDPRRDMPVRLLFLYARAVAAAFAPRRFAPLQDMRYSPDTAIVNWYGPDAKLGMHQDKSEDRVLLEAGSPIVTIALGDSCTFRIGNCQSKSQPYTDFEMRSGDLFVMGGASRMAYHGVMKIHPGTAPPELNLSNSGRISVTIRQARMR
jgi:alkylated DNA repair protein (DNA oxidative demethylase)